MGQSSFWETRQWKMSQPDAGPDAHGRTVGALRPSLLGSMQSQPKPVITKGLIPDWSSDLKCSSPRKPGKGKGDGAELNNQDRCPEVVAIFCQMGNCCITMGEPLEIGVVPGHNDTEITLAAARTLAQDSSLLLAKESPLSARG